jgi:hypothetical protein
LHLANQVSLVLQTFLSHDAGAGRQFALRAVFFRPALFDAHFAKKNAGAEK